MLLWPYNICNTVDRLVGGFYPFLNFAASALKGAGLENHRIIGLGGTLEVF